MNRLTNKMNIFLYIGFFSILILIFTIVLIDTNRSTLSGYGGWCFREAREIRTANFIKKNRGIFNPSNIPIWVQLIPIDSRSKMTNFVEMKRSQSFLNLILMRRLNSCEFDITQCEGSDFYTPPLQLDVKPLTCHWGSFSTDNCYAVNHCFFMDNTNGEPTIRYKSH